MQARIGRPEDTEGRLPKEVRTYDLLDGLGVDYRRVDHAPAMTMEDCTEADAALGVRLCKNLLLCNRQQTAFYLLLLPHDKSFSTKEFSAAIGSARLSFAPPEYMERFLDITPGSLSVLGLMNDKDGAVTLYADKDVIDAPQFGCHPCINTSSLAFPTSALTERILPAIGHELHVVELGKAEP